MFDYTQRTIPFSLTLYGKRQNLAIKNIWSYLSQAGQFADFRHKYDHPLDVLLMTRLHLRTVDDHRLILVLNKKKIVLAIIL
jgi:hypothetical protein